MLPGDVQQLVKLPGMALIILTNATKAVPVVAPFKGEIPAGTPYFYQVDLLAGQALDVGLIGMKGPGRRDSGV